jgi:hypothetical protein
LLAACQHHTARSTTQRDYTTQHQTSISLPCYPHTTNSMN